MPQTLSTFALYAALARAIRAQGVPIEAALNATLRAYGMDPQSIEVIPVEAPVPAAGDPGGARGCDRCHD